MTTPPSLTSTSHNEVTDASLLPIPAHRECSNCFQLLQRHLFTKNEYKKPPGSSITCQQCRRNLTAKRCKQPTKPNARQGRRSDSGIKRRPNNFGYCNYLDHLFSMNCFPDIVALQVFTSAKDVSESMAALQAASQHGMVPQNDKTCRVKCLCIGDGSTPRTAALACFIKKWSCVSIDPALKSEWQGREPKLIRGLTGFLGTIAQFVESGNADDGDDVYDCLVILCVHSHARLVESASIENIRAKYNNIPTTLVSLPCCPKFRSHQDVGRKPDIDYDDDCVFSACRKVEVWNFNPSVSVCMPVAIGLPNSS